MQQHAIRHSLRRAAAVSALGLVLGAGSAVAEQQEAQPQAQPSQTQQPQGTTQAPQPIGVIGFDTLDLDNNGTVSRQELQTTRRMSQNMDQQFNNIDRNQDGTIDPAEFARFEQATRPGMMPSEGQMPRGGAEQMRQGGQMQPPAQQQQQ